jgi:predicted chitinase
MLRSPDTALEVAVAWWEAKVPDEAMGNRVRVRRAVNGGDIGLRDTIRLSNLAERIIDEVAP